MEKRNKKKDRKFAHAVKRKKQENKGAGASATGKTIKRGEEIE